MENPKCPECNMRSIWLGDYEFECKWCQHRFINEQSGIKRIDKKTSQMEETDTILSTPKKEAKRIALMVSTEIQNQLLSEETTTERQSKLIKLGVLWALVAIAKRLKTI